MCLMELESDCAYMLGRTEPSLLALWSVQSQFYVPLHDFECFLCSYLRLRVDSRS